METPAIEQLIEEAAAHTPLLQHLPGRARATMARYLALLDEANRTTNLTAIRDVHGMVMLHAADSLAALDAAPEAMRAAGRAADIGPGGGFPVAPLALAMPHCQWTAIESVAKKCRFIETACRGAGIANVAVCCSRGEDAARGNARESFDIVTARAVGPVAALCETGLPLLKTGGLLLLYKTEQAQQELLDAAPAIALLGGEARPSYHYTLPGDQQQRAIMMVMKRHPTPAQYPRAAGIPFKRPLKPGARQ